MIVPWIVTDSQQLKPTATTEEERLARISVEKAVALEAVHAEGTAVCDMRHSIV
jgi:hypothetical protein